MNNYRSHWHRGLRRAVCDRSPAKIVGSNPTGGMDMFVVIVVCCQVEVSATSWSLVQRSPTGCDASRMRRPWPALVRSATKKNIYIYTIHRQLPYCIQYSSVWCNVIFTIPIWKYQNIGENFGESWKIYIRADKRGLLHYRPQRKLAAPWNILKVSRDVCI